MAEEKSISQSKIAQQVPQKVHKRTEETIEALIARIDTSESLLSDKHIEEYFALKTKTIDAVRDDHKDIKELAQHERKYNLLYLLAAGAIVLVLVALVGLFQKDYLDHFFQLLFAFLGGTGVGSYLTRKIQSDSE